MPQELFANYRTTALAADITAGATTLTVNSSAGFPAASALAGQFRARLGSATSTAEIVIVTNVSGTTWTVTRGAEGTTAIGHAAGEEVAPVSTAAQLDEFVQRAYASLTGTLALSGDITPTTFTTNRNDYTTTGLDAAAVLRLSTDASRNLTGIAGGSDGRVLVLHNVGAFNLVLKDADTNSSAANRFAFPSGDVTLTPNAAAVIQYDATASRWRILAGGGGTTDHNALSNLTTGDPHTQYAQQTEFDDHNARHEVGGADAFTGVVPGSAFAPAGLTGATQSSRYVGATASGAPASGTFAVGDFIIDRSGSVWVCTTAGTPGTWTEVAGGGGGGGGSATGMTLVERQTPSATGTVTFSSLGTHTALLFTIVGRSTGAVAASGVNLRFNGDTAANYDQQVMGASGVSDDNWSGTAQSGLDVGSVPGTSAPADYPGFGSLLVPEYRGTTFYKGVLNNNGWASGVGPAMNTYQEVGWWRNTAAITSVTLYLTTGNWVAGSAIACYALTDAAGAGSGSFNDAEGDPAALGTAADGTSTYAARRDHVHAGAHGSLSGVTADQHHAQAHVLTGADHTVSGLTTGHVLTATGATSFAFQAPAGGGSGLYSAYVCIRDEKTSGTNGGTFTSGAWRTRDLNTEHADTGNHASVASNQITLAAGTWRCRATAPALRVNSHQARLQNITDGTTLLTGSTAYSNSGAYYAQTRAEVVGRFTIAASKVIELQHHCSSTFSGDGMGTNNGIGVEIYSVVELWKES